MKKAIRLLFLISLLSLSGCIKEESILPEVGKEPDLPQTIDTGINIPEEKTDITLHGYLSSGINIPGNDIYISGGVFIYNNIFSINIPKKGLTQREFYNMHGDTLTISDGDLNELQINKYSLSQSSKCDYNFEEGVRSISKSTKTINGIKVNLANVLFEITGPGIEEPIGSRQSFLCFTKDDAIYKITIGDDKKFRTDIINSFKFLK